jgi:hypothetical protein
MSRIRIFIFTAFAATIISAIAPSVAQTPHSNILVLPYDQATLDELSVRGSREWPSPYGLSRIVSSSNNETFLIVNEQDAIQRRILDNLTRMPNDTTISINVEYWNGLRWNTTHFKLRDGAEHTVRYRHFDPALPLQVSALLEARDASGTGGEIQMMEYEFPVDECAGLRDALNALQATLVESASNIGHEPRPAPGEIEEVILGGGYGVSVRMQQLVAQFSVDMNSRQAYDAIREVNLAVSSCREQRLAVQRLIPLWSSGPD